MREDGKRNFLGIVMGGCGRYVFFYFSFLLFFLVFVFVFGFVFGGMLGQWGGRDVLV